ncbi:hypothetical protein HK101_010298, partial [Irineochytrium annulatum]
MNDQEQHLQVRADAIEYMRQHPGDFPNRTHGVEQEVGWKDTGLGSVLANDDILCTYIDYMSRPKQYVDMLQIGTTALK